jgi:hypothetical protein
MSENPAHPTCHVHPGVVLVCPACLGAEGGRIGGKVSSPKKAKAARKNAQRPRPNRGVNKEAGRDGLTEGERHGR